MGVALLAAPLPGRDLNEAARIAAGESGGRFFLPELPGRGEEASPVARALGLLLDSGIAAEQGPRGWRLRARPAPEQRRARDMYLRDLDACQEAIGENPGEAWARVLGPATLAATIELPGGFPALTDRGALGDLAGALGEAAGRLAGELSGRFGPGAGISFDEGLLPDATAGRIAGPDRFDPVRALHPEDAGALLRPLLRPERRSLSFGAAAPDWAAARHAGARRVELALEKVSGAAQLDGLGHALADGAEALLVLPAGGEDQARTPRRRESAGALWRGHATERTPREHERDAPRGPAEPASGRAAAERVARLIDELALDPAAVVPRIDLAPAGPFGDLDGARRALAAARDAAARLEDWARS